METAQHAIGLILMVGATFATPLLTVFAWMGKKKSSRNGLPRWRNALGLISIFAISLNWIGFILLGIALKTGLNTSFYTAGWEVANLFAAVAATAAAFALGGAPRIQAAIAGCFMTAVWLATFRRKMQGSESLFSHFRL